MTGGQMAPTTLIGQKTSTCPYGRTPELHGYPLKITEMAALMEGTCYVTRQSVKLWLPSVQQRRLYVRLSSINGRQGFKPC